MINEKITQIHADIDERIVDGMIVRNTLGLMYIENLTSVALGSYMRPTMAQNESCSQSVAASRSFFENF